MTKYNIYLAAPLFTEAERRFNKDLANLFRAKGLKVFLPQEDANFYPDIPKTFNACCTGVHQSKLVVAVLDGADADSGTSYEVGLAYGLAKPIIGLRTDLRQSGDDGGLNLMLSKSCIAVVDGGKNYETNLFLLVEAALRKLNGED